MAGPVLLNRRPPVKNSPFRANSVCGASITVGAEATNVINVAIQLKDQDGRDLAVRGVVKGYLSNDANGDSLLTTLPTGGFAIGTDGVLIPDSPASPGNALIAKGTLAISATAEKFKTTTVASYTVNGVSHTKAATDNLVFSQAFTVAAAKYGISLVQINAAGTITTKEPSATMSYNSAVLALAALPSADAGNVALGYITLDNSSSDGSSSGAFVANTDDLTDAGDITDSGFVDATEASSNTAPRSFTAVSEADGDIDISITDSGTPTMYMILVLPDGTLVASGAITFA